VARGYSDGFKIGLVTVFAVTALAAFLTGVQISIAPEILARKKPAAQQAELTVNQKKVSVEEGEETSADSGDSTDADMAEAEDTGADTGTETATETAMATEAESEATSETEPAAEPEAEAVEPEEAETEMAETGATETESAETTGTESETETESTVAVVETAEDTGTETAASAGTSDFDIAWAGKPFVENSVAFDNPDDMPVLSIVLVHDDTANAGAADLSDFPYPLTFAIKADWAGAAEAARQYREAGHEVLMMADLPRRAGGNDFAQALQSRFDQVPGAVGVMEGVNVGIDIEPGAEADLTSALQASGHGLVTVSGALGTAQKLAVSEGVPSAAALRYFGEFNLKAPMVARFLDQAALRAQQSEAGVITVGRMSQDTVQGLLQWGLEDRARRVKLAPVSAVLRNGL
jgi:polysaccharide deacetylase 2 family uncharacterized protein YibQ